MDYFWPIVGGAIIGGASILIMLLVGRSGGISGVILDSSHLNNNKKSRSFIFLIGLLIGGFLYHFISGEDYPEVSNNYPLAAIAGLLVGFGLSLSNGCTSGHSYSNTEKSSLRSILSSLVFVFIAILTVFIMKG